MPSKPDQQPMRVNAGTLLRAPDGADTELLAIFLKYNDVLLKRGVGSFNIWMKRAHYLYGLGRYEESVDAIQEALLYDAQQADAHFLLGVNFQLIALERSGGVFEEPLGEETHRLLEAATLAFEATLEMNPHDDEAAGYLVNLRFLLCDPDAGPDVSVLVEGAPMSDLVRLRGASMNALDAPGSMLPDTGRFDDGDEGAAAAPA